MKSKLLLSILIFSFLFSCSQNTKVNNTTTMNEKDITKFTESDWKKKLSPQQYYILREKGTEKPFSGEFVFTKEKGIYKCAACGNELFSDDMKFDSHCGWPSFDKEIAGGKINKSIDSSHGMTRTEITCAKCGSHLGHLFNDGTTETGMRYCINSLSLEFISSEKSNYEEVTLGGGCFWCIEAVFSELKGVEKVESGYSGGSFPNPSYDDVCSGETGHAEVINIKFNPKLISLKEILEVFFTVHDPTTPNQQGADLGTQYRSVIFYRTESQKLESEQIIKTLNDEKAFKNAIVTEVSKFDKFYKAENYHQGYYQNNKFKPYCSVVIKPKLEKLHKIFKEKLK